MQLTVADGFPYYASLVSNENYLMEFKSPFRMAIYDKISEENSQFKYEAGKWSIKQIIGHIIDHERIMTYRILTFSKNDKTLLPGYDQDFFMGNSNFGDLPFEQILEDFKNLRTSTISFIRNLSSNQLKLTGKAWKYEMTIEEYLKSMIGHEIHHFNILQEKYLPNFQ